MNIIAQNYYPDEAFHETKLHGSIGFPYTVYRGNIPGYMRSYPLHWHDEMEIVFAVKGSASIRAENREYVIAGGDMALITPQTIHSISRHGADTLEYFTILFKFKLLCPDEKDEIFQSFFMPLQTGGINIPVLIPKDSGLNREIRPYLADLIENRKTAGFSMKIKSDLFAVMHLLYKNAEHTESNRISAGKTYDRLKKIILFVRQNYMNAITVREAAEHCAVSESHFMKLFRDMAGCSFISYVKNFRLETAARLLSETDRKITGIAGECGFSSASYFTRAFEQKYGCPPSRFREERRNASGGTVEGQEPASSKQVSR